MIVMASIVGDEMFQSSLDSIAITMRKATSQRKGKKVVRVTLYNKGTRRSESNRMTAVAALQAI